MRVLDDLESPAAWSTVVSDDVKASLRPMAHGDGKALCLDYNFNGVSGYVQVTSPSTATHLCITKAGDRTDVRLDVGTVTLSDQRIVTLILVRAATGNLVKGLTLDQQSALLALTP